MPISYDESMKRWSAACTCVCLIVALFALGCRQAKPVKLTVSGPASVPENTEYVYAATRPATWTANGGTIANGQNTDKVTIDWGAGPKAGDVTATDKGDTNSTPVDIVQVTITPNPIAPAQVTNRGVADHFQYAQTVAPGVQFSANVRANGTGKEWKNQIEVGFVQVLRSAPTWTASYPSNPTVLTPNYTTQLPWHDLVDNVPATSVWYAGYTAGTYYTAAKNPGGVIKINDSPKPGWWHQNQGHGSSGELLLEASVKWEFDTYICVHSLAKRAEAVYTIRDSAHWVLSANYLKNRQPNEVEGRIDLPNPPNVTPDPMGHNQPSPITGDPVNQLLRALDFH